MKLTNLHTDFIEGYELPKFNVEEMRKNTQDNCTWLHFGAGNLFRSFPAARMQDLLEKGICKTGIVVAEGFDHTIIDDIYKKYDNNYLLVTLKSSNEVEKRVISSVATSYKASPFEEEDYNKLKRIFINPKLQMVSFTITEKGYDISSPFIQEDILKGLHKANTIMAVITSLVYERFKAGEKPLAFVSMDNCSNNGEKLKASVISIAKIWVEKKGLEKEFTEYLEDSNLDEANLKLIPFFMASYIRYLMGINDDGESFNLSSDPRSDELWNYVKALKIKEYTNKEAQELLKPILQLDDLWGFDLYNSKLKDVVVDDFIYMASQKSKVRELLHLKLN